MKPTKLLRTLALCFFLAMLGSACGGGESEEDATASGTATGSNDSGEADATGTTGGDDDSSPTPTLSLDIDGSSSSSESTDYPDPESFCGSVIELGRTIRESGDADVDQLNEHAIAIVDRTSDDVEELLAEYFEVFANFTAIRAQNDDGSQQAALLEAGRVWAAQDHTFASAYLASECSPGPLLQDDQYNITLQSVIVEGMGLRDVLEASGDELDDLNQ